MADISFDSMKEMLTDEVIEKHLLKKNWMNALQEINRIKNHLETLQKQNEEKDRKIQELQKQVDYYTIPKSPQ